MDKMEIILRFVGFTREEMKGMSEDEIFRKTFSTISLIEELLSGFGNNASPSLIPETFHMGI